MHSALPRAITRPLLVQLFFKSMRLPIRMVPLAKHAIHHWNGEEASKPRDASFLSQFLYKKNNHNLAVLASINLKSMPFYTSHASDSDGIKIITCNKMTVGYGCHADSKEDARLYHFIWSEFFYTQEQFYTKGKLII